MKPAKLAPNIAEWLEQCDRHGLLWHKPMRSEFRALLRVARAARREHGWMFGSKPCGNPACRLCPAFAALDRASGAPRRKP